MLTVSVPQGNEAPYRLSIRTETQCRAIPPTALPHATQTYSMPEFSTELCEEQAPFLRRWVRLADERMYHVSVNVREAESTSLVFEGQSLVVDSQEMEHGRLQVMDMDGILNGIHA